MAFRNEFRVRMSLQLCGTKSARQSLSAKLWVPWFDITLEQFLEIACGARTLFEFFFRNRVCSGESRKIIVHITHGQTSPVCSRSTARKGRALPRQSSWYWPCAYPVNDSRQYKPSDHGRTCTSLRKLRVQDTRDGRRQSAVPP